MNHLCFIIDNSLTVDQKPNNGVTLLDQAKSAIETSLRNLARIGFPNTNQYIHLFVTSHPESPLSSFQHDQNHLSFQLKAIKTSIDTDPALTLQNALNHISRFRVLTEAQTMKGYRQAFIYQPALIIFFTDRMTKQKVQKLSSFIDQGRIHMRSEYQFVSYILCQPSLNQRNILTEQSFKMLIENQIKNGFGEVIRKVNGELKYSMHPQNFTNSLWNRIEGFKPFLFFNFTLKELKKKTNGFIDSERGVDYFSAWKNFLSSVPFQLVPVKLWKIPLPFETKAIQENGAIKIQKLGQLQFNLDLTKKFTQNLSGIMPENRYKILQNPFTSQLQNQKLEQKYPIYFQYKNAQILVGLLQVAQKNSQIVFYFPNFIHLNAILKNIQMQQNQKIIQSTVYPYLIPLPNFYIKFLKVLFDKLHLEINYDALESSILNSLNLKLQNSLEHTRSFQKQNLAKLYQTNVQLHQNNKAECCYIYSQKYEYTSKILSQNPSNYDETQCYFQNLIDELIDFKIKFGIQDYVASTRITCSPVVRQLQKYSTIAKRSGDQDFNQNISINLGNPYKKKKKNSQSQTKDTINAEKLRKEELAMRYSDESRFITEQPDKTDTKKTNKQELQSKNIVNYRQNLMFEEKSSSKTLENQNKHKIKEKTHIQKPKKQPINRNSYIQCQTVRRINSFPKQKQIEVSFSQKNLATEKMQKNESIYQAFMQKLKKK